MTLYCILATLAPYNKFDKKENTAGIVQNIAGIIFSESFSTFLHLRLKCYARLLEGVYITLICPQCLPLLWKQ